MIRGRRLGFRFVPVLRASAILAPGLGVCAKATAQSSRMFDNLATLSDILDMERKYAV